MKIRSVVLREVCNRQTDKQTSGKTQLLGGDNNSPSLNACTVIEDS